MLKITKPNKTSILIEGDELVAFTPEVQSKTGLIDDEKYDENYSIFTLFYRFPGMDSSKQIIMGNTISIEVILASLMHTLLEEGVLKRSDIYDILTMVLAKAYGDDDDDKKNN